MALQLAALPGVGVDTAGQLLVTAGGNAARLRTERSFARLCGVAPIPVSSGRTGRHRLHRGDRLANSALCESLWCGCTASSAPSQWISRVTTCGRALRQTE